MHGIDTDLYNHSARFYGHTADEVMKLGLQADPEDYEKGMGYDTPLFRTEPSTYHDLHCLVGAQHPTDWVVWTDDLQNYIRKALDWEYYTDITVSRTAPEHPGHASHRLHLGTPPSPRSPFPHHSLTNLPSDHCIELMRQSFLCHMDLTPIPRKWLVNGNMTHADQDQVHMCRAREPFHEWIKAQDMERLVSSVP
jgi:hypothetical protein